MQATVAALRLMGFVKKEHNSGTMADKLLCGIVEVLFDCGLKECAPSGFELQWVELSVVDSRLADLKKQAQPCAASLTTVMRQFTLHRYFAWSSDHSGQTLLMPNMSELLPCPSRTVKALLPNVKWNKQHEQGSSLQGSEQGTMQSEVTAADSVLQLHTSTSSQLTADDSHLTSNSAVNGSMPLARNIQACNNLIEVNAAQPDNSMQPCKLHPLLIKHPFYSLHPLLAWYRCV